MSTLSRRGPRAAAVSAAGVARHTRCRARTIEHDVVRHYTHGSLEQAILAGLIGPASPNDSSPLERLAAVDEFHIGGRQATDELASQLQLRPRLRVLDTGCGIGGTARWLASRYQCRVTGVDVTPEYVDVGNSLNRRLCLSGSVTLRVASAFDLPFERECFDRATLLHVGMNVPDKGELFNEVSGAEATRIAWCVRPDAHQPGTPPLSSAVGPNRRHLIRLGRR